MIQRTYGDNTTSRTCDFAWYKSFLEECDEVKDDSRSGKPSTSRTVINVKRERQVLCGDRRLSVRLIAIQLDRKRVCVWRIFPEDSNMRKICSKMVPRLPNDDQMEHSMHVRQDIIEHLQTGADLLRRVVTSDET